MPYSGISDPSLPKDVQDAPEGARRRFVGAFNSAHSDCLKKNGKDCEGQAFRIARSAMSEDHKHIEQEIETYLKSLDDIQDEKGAPACERCNGALDASAKSLAGMQLCAECNIELTKAVIAENKDTLKKHFGGKGILDRLFGVKDKSETGFKVLEGNKWVAWYTNARKDLEGEKFSYEGLMREVKRQNETGDYPELWFYHIAGTRHGKANGAFIVNDMVVAVGTFDDTPMAESMKKYYQKSVDVALSHGFVYDGNKFDGETYQEFKTFEISTLPRGKEANPYTSFGLLEIKAMDVKVNEDQKQALELALGSEVAGQVLAQSPDALKAATKALDGIVNYKAPKMEMEDEEDGEGKDEKKPPYMKSADEGDKAVGVKAEDVASAVLTLLAPQLETLTKAITGIHERVVQIEGSPKQKQMPRNPDVEMLFADKRGADEDGTQYINETFKAVHRVHNKRPQ